MPKSTHTRKGVVRKHTRRTNDHCFGNRSRTRKSGRL